MAAGHSVDARRWDAETDGLFDRVALRFPRVETRRRVRRFVLGLLADLPHEVDPCGERGEFHTFCFAGPMFRQEIGVRVGHTVSRDGFCFTDVVPA